MRRLTILVALLAFGSALMGDTTVNVERLPENPIITPSSSATIGQNINGPSLIRVPTWVRKPLGRYYLYFAHHKGKYIRLAYADNIAGPWTIHDPGALELEDSLFPTRIEPTGLTERQREQLERIREAGYLYPHIASPEAVVVPHLQEIRLYYHGMLETGMQATRVATSNDGLSFKALPEVITRPYLRIVQWKDHYYGMAMPGVFYRSKDGVTGFEEGPTLFNPDMRHAALMIRDATLLVFWTQVGHEPERILLSTIDISGDWRNWRESAEPIEVLRPNTSWEGADLPLEPSVRGAIEEPANQLRDPAIYEEDGRTWLIYSIAGESGIAIAEIKLP